MPALTTKLGRIFMAVSLSTVLEWGCNDAGFPSLSRRQTWSSTQIRLVRTVLVPTTVKLGSGMTGSRARRLKSIAWQALFAIVVACLTWGKH